MAVTPEPLPAAPVPWRSYGVALVPLALAGLLPLWAVGLLCVVFGLGARFTSWGEARFLSTLLLVGLAVAGPLRETFRQTEALAGPALLGLFFIYILQIAASLLVFYGAELLEEGRRRGLLAVLLAGLFAPTPLLVLALAGGALARPGPDDRSLRVRPPVAGEQAAARRGWAWVGAAVLGVVLLAALLPQPRPALPPPPTGAGQTTNAAPKSEGARPRPPQASASSRGSAPTRSVAEWRGKVPPPPLELMLSLVVLLFLLLLWRLLQEKGERTGRKRLTLLDWLAPTALLLNLLVLLLLGLGNSRNAAAPAPAAPGPQGSGEEARALAERLGRVLGLPMDLLALLLWALLALTLVALLLLAYMLLSERRVALASAAAGPAAPQPPAEVPAPALHRIRLAYLAAEDALARAGRGRAPAETPTGYAVRVGQSQPELAAPLGLLCRLYAPVRYGGQTSDTDADAAEAASREVCTLAAQLPPLAPDEPTKSSAPEEQPI